MWPFTDHAAERSQRSRDARKINKGGVKPATNRGQSTPRKAPPRPFTCGQPCSWNGPGTTCQSIVRDGVHCPCRYC